MQILKKEQGYSRVCLQESSAEDNKSAHILLEDAVVSQTRIKAKTLS